MVQQIVDWLDERIDLRGLKHFVAEKGVPVHAQEIWYYLTLARPEVHTFDAAHVAPVVAEGVKVLADIDAAGETATAELRFRRRGLAVSLGAILLVVIGLGFKIRQLDRRLTNP